MLSADQVAYSYRSWRRRRPVFSDFYWSVPQGRRTVLLGPNGAGKTTLLKLLAGVLLPEFGVVNYSSASSRGQRVALMPQDIYPLRGMRVLDQVAYASWLAGNSLLEAKASARSALDRVGLADRSGDGANQLSGGQLRRVGLAEVLATKSQVLLLDEPTAGLDPAQRLNFRQILAGLDPAEGLVVSTHDVRDLDQDFDHVTVLHEGRIVFDGSPEEFIELGAARGIPDTSYEAIFTDLVAGGSH